MVYIKGITRFNYWDYPAINPALLDTAQTLDGMSTGAHQDLSAMYQRDYTAGVAAAIFEYAKADVWAFRAPWVVAQIEAWRSENTPESREKLHKLMHAYTDDRGKDRLADTVRLITRDQAAYKHVMRLHEQGKSIEHACAVVAKDQRMGVESVREVYRHYQRKVGELMGNPPSRPVRRLVEEMLSRHGAPAPNWQQRTTPDAAASWQDAVQRLEAMAQRLEGFLGQPFQHGHLWAISLAVEMCLPF